MEAKAPSLCNAFKECFLKYLQICLFIGNSAFKEVSWCVGKSQIQSCNSFGFIPRLDSDSPNLHTDCMCSYNYPSSASKSHFFF